MYKYWQPNKKDLKDQVGDCCLRAMCKFMNMTWLEVFDELVEIARENQDIINSNTTYEQMLKNHNCVYHKFPRSEKKPLLKHFAKQNKNSKIFCLVRVGYGGHCVCIEDGNWYDTWDCGEYKLTGYWTLN